MAKSIRTASSPLKVGVASRALPGESASGDQSFVRELTKGVLVGVVDALGHGRDAAAAASRAIATFERYAHESLPSMVQRCHADLVGTRGVVVSLASFALVEQAMSWLGVGNVEGVLFSADPRAQKRSTMLVSRAGIVGGDLPKIDPRTIPLSQGDTLVFTTDGIRPGFATGLDVTADPDQLAEWILENHARETDDALVMVVRYLGAG